MTFRLQVIDNNHLKLMGTCQSHYEKRYPATPKSKVSGSEAQKYHFKTGKDPRINDNNQMTQNRNPGQQTAKQHMDSIFNKNCSMTTKPSSEINKDSIIEVPAQKIQLFNQSKIEVVSENREIQNYQQSNIYVDEGN